MLAALMLLVHGRRLRRHASIHQVRKPDFAAWVLGPQFAQLLGVQPQDADAEAEDERGPRDADAQRDDRAGFEAFLEPVCGFGAGGGGGERACDVQQGEQHGEERWEHGWCNVAVFFWVDGARASRRRGDGVAANCDRGTVCEAECGYKGLYRFVSHMPPASSSRH